MKWLARGVWTELPTWSLRGHLQSAEGGDDKYTGQNRIIKFQTLPVTVEQISNPHRQFGFQRELAGRVGILADRRAEGVSGRLKKYPQKKERNKKK